MESTTHSSLRQLIPHKYCPPPIFSNGIRDDLMQSMQEAHRLMKYKQYACPISLNLYSGQEQSQSVPKMVNFLGNLKKQAKLTRFFALTLINLKLSYYQIKKLNYIIYRYFKLEVLILHIKYTFPFNALLLHNLLKQKNNIKKIDFAFLLRSTQNQDRFSLPRELKYLTSLRALILNFEAYDIEEPGVVKLGIVIGRLTKLQKIDINFNRNKIDSQIIANFIQQIKKVKQLADLKLSFDEDIIRADVIQALSNSLKTLTSLRSVYLNLSESFSLSQGFDCFMTDEKMALMAQSLEGISQLSSLMLELTDCKKVTSVSLYHLAKLLDKLLSLTHFHLKVRGLSDEKDINEGLYQLAQAISKKALTSLHLDLGDNKINDQGLITIIGSLASLPIQVLSLGLLDCTSITGQGFVKAIKKIKDISTLEILNLNIHSCRNFDYDSLEALADSIPSSQPSYSRIKEPSLSKLKKLNLSIDRPIKNHHLHARALNTLKERLKELPQK